MVWAEDDPALCAIRERGNLCILRNGASMEQHAFTAHLCSFSSLEVQVAITMKHSMPEILKLDLHNSAWL